MRDVKIHQEIVREQYNMIAKEDSKKASFHVKKETRGPQKRTIYDFKGSVIEPFKSDAIRLPSHFV